jgi:hypothetical protein
LAPDTVKRDVRLGVVFVDLLKAAAVEVAIFLHGTSSAIRKAAARTGQAGPTSHRIRASSPKVASLMP